MNQIQFETSKVYGVFVMLPDGAHRCKLEIDESKRNYILYYIGQQPKQFYLQAHYDDLQGFVSELTDEQKEGVVPNVDMTGYGKLFPNYLDDEGTLFMDVDQSFETLTDFLKVYIDNPYGDEPKQNEYRFLTKPHNLHMTDVWKKEYDAWQTAQQNVGQWILLTANK